MLVFMVADSSKGFERFEATRKTDAVTAAFLADYCVRRGGTRGGHF
jgi:hypothetical protein